MTGSASLLDAILPRFDFSSRHALAVAAPADRAWQALISADLRDPPVARLLLRLRGYGFRATPDRLRGSLSERLTDLGFVPVGERPGSEVVFGVVGRFWTISGGLRPVSPAEFLPFEQEGFAKAAWNLTVASRGGSESMLATETRILCFGEAARRRFAIYWRAIRPFSGLIRRAMLRSIRDRAVAGALPS